MKLTRLIGLGLLGLGLLAGCASPPTDATAVFGPDYSLQCRGSAPTVPARGPDGKLTTLHKMTGDLYVVAFVPSPADKPCHIDPRIRQLADRLFLDEIAVVQVSTPPAGAKSAADAKDTQPPTRWNLLHLYDPYGAAWQAFGRPKPGTVVLVDRFNRICRTGSLDGNINEFIRVADDKAEEFSNYQAGLFHGGSGISLW